MIPSIEYRDDDGKIEHIGNCIFLIIMFIVFIWLWWIIPNSANDKFKSIDIILEKEIKECKAMYKSSRWYKDDMDAYKNCIDNATYRYTEQLINN